MIRLSDIPKREDGSVDEEKLDNNVIGMLEVLLKGDLSATQRKGILEKHYGIEMTERLEEEVSHMCNLSQGVMNRGIEKGLAQGIEKGIEKGVLQATVTMLKKAMEKNNWSLEEAMRFFDLSLSDKDMYAAALN